MGRVIKGILFDKDGTLIEFNRTWIPAYEQGALYVAKKANKSNIIAELMVKGGFNSSSQYWKPGSPLACGNILQISKLWGDVAGIGDTVQLAKELEAIFNEVVLNNPLAVTNLDILFGNLKNKGLKIGLVTMDSEYNAQKTMRMLQVENHFDFISGFDSGFGSKPAVGMVKEFCRITQLPADEVMIIGDSPVDLQMARNASAGQAIAVLSGAHNRGDLQVLADAILKDVSELEEFLK